MKTNSLILISLLLVTSFTGTRTFAAPDCVSCGPIKLELLRRTKEKAQLSDVKKRNEDYLKAHPDATSSERVKISSNIIICQVRIETHTNEIDFINKKLAKECTGCP